MKIRVYYEDTDIGGIVYHTNYIKFCERDRSEIFFEKRLKLFDDGHSGFVVHNIQADFLATSTLGEILNITTKLLTIKSSSLILLQEIWKGDVKVFSMKIRLVYIDDGRPRRIPDAFKKVFTEL